MNKSILLIKVVLPLKDDVKKQTNAYMSRVASNRLENARQSCLNIPRSGLGKFIKNSVLNVLKQK